MLYAELLDLGAGPGAAITLGRNRPLRLGDHGFARQPVALTALGERLLEGKADWWRGSTRTRAFGGVRLRGPAPRWRFDERRGVLVRSASG